MKESENWENIFSPEYAANSITDLKFELEWAACYSCYRKYKQQCEKEYKDWDVGMNICLILRKVARTQHGRYGNSLLPRHPTDININHAIEILCRISNEKRCVNIEKKQRKWIYTMC